jgi:DNA polymerase (family 10)
VPRANEQVAAALAELARLTILDEADPQSFRVRTYQNAERSVRGLTQDVADMSTGDLTKVKGIGKSTAAKIRQHVDEGRIDKLDALRERYPAAQVALLRLEGMGPKSVRALQDDLGVTDLDGLQAAIADGSIGDVDGFGPKTVENLQDAIARAGDLAASGEDRRTPIAAAHAVAMRLRGMLGELDAVQRVEVAGSLRRYRETIGDVDLLVAAEEGDAPGIMAALRDHPEAADVLVSGDTKTSIRTHDGLQVDLRVVGPDRFGAALVYFTGSKAHNIQLRQRALARGLTLNEYGLAPSEKVGDGAPSAEDRIAGATEQDVYAALDLAWVTPELREDGGEVEQAAEGGLPAMITPADLTGDLHHHSSDSGDGDDAYTLDVLAGLAVERGREWIGITDHAEDLAINGLSRAEMLDQRQRLRALEAERGDLRLLHGVELNISADGDLDYDAEFRLGFDFCTASVHSAFRRSADEQTARLVRVIADPAVTVVGHLTGRKLGHRSGIDLDIDAVCDALLEHGVALELNGALPRLDAPVELARVAMERGVLFAVSTDAHAPGDLANEAHGCAWARRAGVPPERIVTTWSHERVVAWIADQRA